MTSATWLPRLGHRRDWQSLAYVTALPALAAWQWVHGFSVLLYAPMLFLTLGIGTIHHNHVHRPMWHGRRANRLTDFVLTLLQGYPSFIFWPSHVANHHRHGHGEKDLARTYRFARGDTNDLLGYLLHPFEAVPKLYPLFRDRLGELRRRRPRAYRYCQAQCALWLGSWALLLAVDWQRALLFVIVPQLHGIHWLLATNYLQHAHADGRSSAQGEGAARGSRGIALNYARNFEGLLNPLLFNIGLHTAHHENPSVHWFELVELHRTHYRDRVDAALNEHGVVPYMFRVYVLGAVLPRYRSHSLMASDSTQS